MKLVLNTMPPTPISNSHHMYGLWVQCSGSNGCKNNRFSKRASYCNPHQFFHSLQRSVSFYDLCDMHLLCGISHHKRTFCSLSFSVCSVCRSYLHGSIKAFVVLSFKRCAFVFCTGASAISPTANRSDTHKVAF